MRVLALVIVIASLANAAPPATTPVWVRPAAEAEPTTKPGTQKYSVHEHDENSPRKSKLKSNKPDGEIVRIDVDGDGDPDILECWWNGKRVRWLDDNGNSIFLKQHKPPGVTTNPQFNWENPFAFYDTDGDGCTEMTIRLLDIDKKTGGTDNDPRYTYNGFAYEAMGGWDLDNDST